MHFLTTIIGVFFVIWLARMAFGHGGFGRMPWRNMWNGGPWNNTPNSNSNNNDVPPWVEEWHRKLHEKADVPASSSEDKPTAI